MTTTRFLELLVSLSAQAAALIAVTHWLCRWVREEETECRLWTWCYSLLLGLVGLALIFPHPRWISIGPYLDRPRLISVVSAELTFGRMVLAAWLVGALGSLCVMIVRSLQITRFIGQCDPVGTSSESQEVLKELCGSPSVSGPVRLVAHPALSGPFCWQFHRPLIAMPTDLLLLDPQSLRYIFKHELAHLKTGHPLQLFIQRVVEVLFWFHPMVWRASLQTLRTREFVCDNASVNGPSDAVGYLKTLLYVVERNPDGFEQSPGTLTFSRGRGLIAERARRLVERCRRPALVAHGSNGRVALLSLCLMATLATTFWLPVDALASNRAHWSPWPAWSAGFLHDIGISVRDFESYDNRLEVVELLHSQAEHSRP